jgi:hypothetical protein
MLLNVYLDRHLDQVWDHQRWPMLRYADDVILLTKCWQEARAAHATLRNLLCPQGLRLRSDEAEPRILLCGESITWLGYSVHLDGDRAVVRLPDSAWDKLTTALEWASEHEDGSGAKLFQTLNGWLEYAGPAYGSGPDLEAYRHSFTDRTAQALITTIAGPRYVPEHKIEQLWRSAHDRWQARRLSHLCLRQTTPRDGVGSAHAH